MTRAFRLSLALLLSLSVGRLVLAQETKAFPYALDPIKDSAWIAGGLSLYGGSLYLDSIKPLGGITTLDHSSIPWFDRLYTSSHSASLGTAADVLVLALATLPVVDLPGLDTRETLTLGTMYAETLGLAYGLDALIKSVVVRERPYAYANPPPSDAGSLDIVSSFPSRHTTLAFASAVFAASTFEELHPDSAYRWAVWGGGLGTATLIASLRLASGDHFLSDVVAGAALGTVLGLGVPYLHKLVDHRSGATTGEKLSLSLSPAGIIFAYRP